MHRKVAVLQSNYIPWKGYFDIIHDVDLFVFYDTVQYTKNDWRNRNRIKGPGGGLWLTVPVGTSLNRLVCDVAIEDDHWQIKHWKTLAQYYSKAPHFPRYADLLRKVYLETRWKSLSELNQYVIRAISRDVLGITTEIVDSREIETKPDSMAEDKVDRLIALLKKVEARTYVSGPSGINYIDPARFESAGIDLVFKSYDGYPGYPQFLPPFDHAVSVVDLLFHAGPESPRFIWGWR